MTNRAFAVFAALLMVCVAVTGVAVGQTSETTVAGETDGGAAQPKVITSCTTISEPGHYVLAADVENSTENACIRIRASDVVLDGSGHVVDGVESPDSEELTERFFRGLETPTDPTTNVGVSVTADGSLSNVTVTDLTVTDWRWGVVVGDLRGGEIEGVRATNNGFGVAVAGARGVAVTDGVAGDNGVFGVGLFGAEAGEVRNVTASGNGLIGVYHSGGRDGTLSNVTARDNDLGGILVEGTTAATVTDATASGNRIGVYLFGTEDAEVRRATAVENRFAGVYATNATGTSIVESLAADNRLAGVLLQNATDGSVSATNASHNRYGIYLFDASDVVVADSTGNRGVIGVFVRNSSAGAVRNNTVLNNSFTGVFTENSTDVEVADNRDGTIAFESTGNDTIGREGGYRYDDTVEVNQSDGLSEAELEAFVYRAIARAEYLRQLEYEGDVSFEVINQAELERRTAAEPDPSGPESAWENQLWEALFVVGEDENATRVVENQSTRVAGFYSPAADKLVIVSQETDPLTVSSTTLVHEFVHALQDQHFDLTRDELSPRLEDRVRARNGLVEGDAQYADRRFEQYCGVLWDCVQVESKEPRGGEITSARNYAMRQLIFQPYSDGPGYVHDLRERGGWEAVNDAYENPPNATEQVIHADRQDERPAPLEFEDAARGGWRPFEQSNLSFRGENGTTTMGEAAIYAMFWYHGYETGDEIIDVEDHLQPDGAPFDRYNYTSPPSEGWGNDVLVPYRNATSDETEYGYVWQTEWDTPKDAREFRRAYRQLLRGRGAERVDSNTWVVESGSFADAFRVVREGTTVTVVNAPTEADLDDLRPGLADGSASETTANETETANQTETTNDRRPFAAER